MSTVKKPRAATAANRVVDEDREKQTPRSLIRSVAAFDDTPFTARQARGAPRQPTPMQPVVVTAAAAAAAPVFPTIDPFEDEVEVDDEIVVGEAGQQRIVRGLRADTRDRALSLRSQLAAVARQFVDASAVAKAFNALQPPPAGPKPTVASSSGRAGGRMSASHKAALQAGRVAARAKRSAGERPVVNDDNDDDVIGGAAARRQPAAAAAAAAAQPSAKKKRSVMPASWLKPVFASFASGASANDDVLSTVLQISNQYWERVADDLVAYSEHRKSQRRVTAEDVELLFRRQKLTGPHTTVTVDDLARELLPADLRRDTVPIARYGNVVVPAASAAAALAPRKKSSGEKRRRRGTAAP